MSQLCLTKEHDTYGTAYASVILLAGIPVTIDISKGEAENCSGLVPANNLASLALTVLLVLACAAKA